MTHAIFQNDQESKTATLCSFGVKLFAPKVLLKVFTWKTLSAVSVSKLRCRMGCGSISSGDPCAITNYCMNSYLVLQVTRAYIQQTAFSLCFQRSWLVETGLGLTDSRFWLVGSCQGLVVLHWSGYCTQVLGTPQCLFMCRERWSDLNGLVSKKRQVERNNLLNEFRFKLWIIFLLQIPFNEKCFNDWGFKGPAKLARTQVAFEWFLAWKEVFVKHQMP